MLRIRQGWWVKHQHEFERVEGEALRKWCIEQHQNQEFAVVIVVSEVDDCGYSASEGLIGRMEV